MNIYTIIIISIGLAMDAFAVSISSGTIIKKIKIRHAFKIAIFFGAFQAIMPIIGWSLGLKFVDKIKNYDHWIAFIILFFIGIKMIKEAKELDKCNKTDPLKLSYLLILSIATSIDALAVGFSFACLKISIFLPIEIIGIITFFMSFLGVYIGNKLGHLFENKIEIIGGIILILIGFKILFEHIGII